jgi:FAD/FMN-containing dehydrogenase
VIAAPPTFRGRFCTGLPERSAYSEGAGPYRIVPSAVAIPADLDDLVALVRHAVDNGVALVPRGAGSGMPGGNVGRGIVVDLQRFGDAPVIGNDGVATVGAGITWSALDRAARHAQLHLPPNPSSGPFCTLGGMAATNAAGPRSVWAGSIRLWIVGLRMVTADGEVTWIDRDEKAAPSRSTLAHQIDRDVRPTVVAARDLLRRSFPAALKNSSGYALDAYLDSGDMLDLVIGSEGTLGIITELRLRLAERPSGIAGLLVAVADLSELGEIVQSLRRLEPSAVELLDRSFLDVARAKVDPSLDRSEAAILVDFERASGSAAQGAVVHAVAAMRRAGVFARPALSAEEHRRLWRLRHAASPALAALPETQRSLQIIEDGCVPVPALGRYLLDVRAAARAHGIGIVAFGHAGDGHLHVNALVDTTKHDLESRLTSLLETVTTTVTDLGGTPSGEHGDGRLRAPLLSSVFGCETANLFRLIKRSFDPVGIFNPDVIVSEGATASIEHLKVGSHAAPIPDRVAAGLRDLERRGDWAVRKLDVAQPGPDLSGEIASS